MSINIDLYEDSGAVTSGRGATQAIITDWNLKYSALSSTVYYPTAVLASAPLVRPTNPGEEFLSYKKYLSFKVDGTYTRVKNLRIKVTGTGSQASTPRLFYKFTNTYAVPDAAYDGDMMLLSSDGTVHSPVLYPYFSTTGPQNATSRSVVYGPNQTLYTNWIVVQMRIPYGCTAGNSAEFKLELVCDEY